MRNILHVPKGVQGKEEIATAAFPASDLPMANKLPEITHLLC